MARLANGNPQLGPKFSYKMTWFDRLIDHAAGLLHEDVPAVLAGDFNVVPTDFDIYSTKSYLTNALLQTAPRAAIALDIGWTDALRALYPDNTMFTFWSYLRHRWPLDAGLRLDHRLVSPALVPRLVDAGVDRDVRGQNNASDHAPAWIELSKRRGARKFRIVSDARGNAFNQCVFASFHLSISGFGRFGSYRSYFGVPFRGERQICGSRG